MPRGERLAAAAAAAAAVAVAVAAAATATATAANADDAVAGNVTAAAATIYRSSRQQRFPSFPSTIIS